MQAFYYLNYVVYDYYVRKRDSVPLSASFLLPVLLVYFNVFSIIYWASIYFNFQPPFAKKYAILFFIALATLSYFILYHKSRYKEVFASYEKGKNEMQRNRRYVRAYIISSIILLLATLVAADIRVDGHL